jgi:hypothetical protein
MIVLIKLVLKFFDFLIWNWSRFVFLIWREMIKFQQYIIYIKGVISNSSQRQNKVLLNLCCLEHRIDFVLSAIRWLSRMLNHESLNWISKLLFNFIRVGSIWSQLEFFLYNIIWGCIGFELLDKSTRFCHFFNRQ